MHTGDTGERERGRRSPGEFFFFGRVVGGLTKRFCASLKHRNVGQKKFIKPNSQR